MNNQEYEWGQWSGHNMPWFDPNSFTQKMQEAEVQKASRSMLFTEKATGKRYLMKVSIEETDIPEPEDRGETLLDMHPKCWF